jgi:hypothetical protein
MDISLHIDGLPRLDNDSLFDGPCGIAIPTAYRVDNITT